MRPDPRSGRGRRLEVETSAASCLPCSALDQLLADRLVAIGQHLGVQPVAGSPATSAARSSGGRRSCSRSASRRRGASTFGRVARRPSWIASNRPPLRCRRTGRRAVRRRRVRRLPAGRAVMTPSVAQSVGCASWASTTATAVMLTMPRAVTDCVQHMQGRWHRRSSSAQPASPSPTDLSRLYGDIGGVHRGHDQEVGVAGRRDPGNDRFAESVEGGVAMHLAVDLQIRWSIRAK